MKKIIPISEPNIGKKEISYVLKAVKSGWVSSLGYYIEKFENSFAKYCGRKYGASVSNGTVALHLALLALDIKANDEIIVPDFAFIAVANAVNYIGAKAVPVDIKEDTWNINAKKIEEKITNKTKAIIVVHTYGHPADMDEILKISKKYNLFVIEDAAEAHGAEYKGKKVGKFGDISCFSFYGNKTITTGEGGMCLTDDKTLYEKMLLLRDHGMTKEKKYWHQVVGYNYRITNLQAALGCAQLERINEFVKIKRKNASLYVKMLKDIPWITLQAEKDYVKSSYWMFSILINEKSEYSRDSVIKKLKDKNIDSRVFFYPVSDQPPYKNKLNDKNLEISKKIAYQGLNLPSSTKLTVKEIKYICGILKNL
jgi:perosamine synthetase